MKRLIPALLLLLALCACAGPESAVESAPADYVHVEEIARAVLDSQLDPAGLEPLEGEERDVYLSDICGIDEGQWTEMAVYLASGVDAREVIVLRLAQDDYAQAVTQTLEAHRQSRTGDFFGYAPDQAALLEEARVVSAAGYAALLACADPAGAEEAFLAAAAGEAAPEPADSPAPPETEPPAESGTPAESASPAPEPTPVPSAEPSPVSEPTPAPTPEATLDVSAFVPFDPPNEHDMTLYDTSAILAAWESGDESGLSEKDAAILSACRALFAEHVTQGMTDLEKELALHDALLELGSYDRTVYAHATPQGRPDNTNPYGMLVGGYGICLGYATTFQLLMDLAGVECITVVGASYGSTSDHAWNLVRLEGEWYAVDPTWNDPTGGENTAGEAGSRLHHRYFNVTSDYLRDTDHQWDYLSVPEAEGTRFYWDGTGPLPE